MVELQPSKLITWVRFPSPAPSQNKPSAHIAQSVEHFLGKEEVTGSNPVMSSSFSFLLASINCSLVLLKNKLNAVVAVLKLL